MCCFTECGVWFVTEAEAPCPWTVRGTPTKDIDFRILFLFRNVGVAFDGIKAEVIKLMSTTNAVCTSIINQQQEEIDALKGDVAQLRMSMAVLIEAVSENTDKIKKHGANKLHMLAQSLQ